MKKLLFIILILTYCVSSYAQQEPRFTQYMFNKVYINPAAAGSSGALCFSGIGRLQWMGMQDEQGNNISPKTFGLSADLPIYRIKSGVGLTFNYDQLGAEKNIDINLLYAYHHIFKNNHMLSAGLNLALLNKTIDYSMLQTHEIDPSLPQNTSENGMITDIGLGLQYKIPRKFYAGFSMNNLLGSSAEIGGPDFELARHYYLYAGYDINFYNKKRKDLILTPGLLMKATNGSVQLDINAIFTYDNFFWAGLVYNTENAVGVMAGIKFSGVSIGVAYDYTLGGLTKAGNGSSIEVFIKYCYPMYPREPARSGYNTRNL